MKVAVWLSYDLGVKGDYEGLYAWLDENHAKECGDSVAFFSYEYSESFLEDISKNLHNSMNLTKNTRIYIIYRNPKTKKVNGRFILGRRKAPPWVGYAVTVEDALADVDES